MFIPPRPYYKLTGFFSAAAVILTCFRQLVYIREGLDGRGALHDLWYRHGVFHFQSGKPLRSLGRHPADPNFKGVGEAETSTYKESPA